MLIIFVKIKKLRNKIINKDQGIKERRDKASLSYLVFDGHNYIWYIYIYDFSEKRFNIPSYNIVN